MQNIVPRRASISQGPSSVAKITDEAIQERLATISSELPSDSPTFWAQVNKCVNGAEVSGARFSEQIKFLKSIYPPAAQNPSEPVVQGFDSFRAFVSQSGSGGGFEFLVNELSQCTLSQQASAAKSHAIINSYMQSFFEGELRQLKVKQEQYTSGEQQYLHDARKLFMLRQDSDPVSLQKYAQGMATKKPFLDLQRFDLDVAVKELDERQRIAVLKTLSETFRIQQEHYIECAERMEKCLSMVNDLNTTLGGLQRMLDATTNQRRKVRRDIEKSAFDCLSGGPIVLSASSGIRDQLGAAVVKGSSTKEGQLWIPDKKKDYIPVYCKIHLGMFSLYKKDERPIHVELLLCSVREPREEKLINAFQLVSPVERMTLHAASQEEVQSWISSIQMAISDQLNSQPSKSTSTTSASSTPTAAVAAAEAAKKEAVEKLRKEQFELLQKVDGNRCCADCNAVDPDWVSINLGLLICLECSGVHRAMGVHISKVRSLTLDKLEPNLVRFLMEIGNTKSNTQIWEEQLYHQTQYNAGAVDELRQAIIKRDGKDSWIRSKYERREYMMSDPFSGLSSADLCMQLYAAVSESNYTSMIKLLRMGANINFVNESDENRCCLHQAVNIGSEVGTELLLQHGANVDLVDVRLWTPLHYAAYHEDFNCAEMLLLRGANPTLRDYNSQDCVDLAPEDTPIHQRLSKAKEAAEEKQRKQDESKNNDGHMPTYAGMGSNSSSGIGVMYSSSSSKKKEEDGDGIFSIFSGKSIKEGLSRFLQRRPSISEVQPMLEKR